MRIVFVFNVLILQRFALPASNISVKSKLRPWQRSGFEKVLINSLASIGMSSDDSMNVRKSGTGINLIYDKLGWFLNIWMVDCIALLIGDIRTYLKLIASIFGELNSHCIIPIGWSSESAIWGFPYKAFIWGEPHPKVFEQMTSAL